MEISIKLFEAKKNLGYGLENYGIISFILFYIESTLVNEKLVTTTYMCHLPIVIVFHN